MTTLEMKMNGGNLQPSDNPTNQASHAAAPEYHNGEIKDLHVIFVIAVLMLLVYGLKVLGRVIKSAK